MTCDCGHEKPDHYTSGQCGKCHCPIFRPPTPHGETEDGLRNTIASLKRELAEMASERNLWMHEVETLRPYANTLGEVEAILKKNIWAPRGGSVHRALDAITALHERALIPTQSLAPKAAHKPS